MTTDTILKMQAQNMCTENHPMGAECGECDSLLSWAQSIKRQTVTAAAREVEATTKRFPMSTIELREAAKAVRTLYEEEPS